MKTKTYGSSIVREIVNRVQKQTPAQDTYGNNIQGIVDERRRVRLQRALTNRQRYLRHQERKAK